MNQTTGLEWMVIQMCKVVSLFQNEGWRDVTHKYPGYQAVYQSHDAFITFGRSRVDGHPFVEVECDGNSIPVTMDEIRAIYMQCKELKWLDEGPDGYKDGYRNGCKDTLRQAIQCLERNADAYNGDLGIYEAINCLRVSEEFLSNET